MRAKGKGLKADGSIRNGSQYDAVWNRSSHSVTKTPPRLPVKKGFPKQYEIQHSPSVESFPVGDGDLKEGEQDNNEYTCASEARNRVKVIVDLFREILCKLMRKNDKLVGRMPNIHIHAVSLLQKRVNYLTEKRIGHVPGVEIGDGFESRAELYITGLHLQHNKGIDYMRVDESILATSVVESSRYMNTRNSRGDLIYVGEGGNPMVSSHCRLKDQLMERGNLALKNSMIQKTPVRVIVKSTIQTTASFIYEGLHLVLKCWYERGSNNKYVYKFQLRKMPEQPRNPRGFHCKSNEYELGVVMKDLSRGKEKVPITVVNKIDDKMPSRFTYTSKSTLTNDRVCDWCDCEDGCSDSEDCSCRAKNGGKLPYDYDQCIITRRPSIYECGPSCKCFDSCLNKVSQRGIQIELEVFRTESKRWGVRSRKHIARGSFVCEYVGETVKLKVGNKNGIGDNEYMFIVGRYKKDSCFEDDEVLAIDASRNGNVGRFIQRSSSPNLFVQKVYISTDVTTPHILLFAMNDIKPLEELTYEYNWRIKM